MRWKGDVREFVEKIRQGSEIRFDDQMKFWVEINLLNENMKCDENELRVENDWDN